MTVPVLTFFNNKGGVGKTSLVYHLAWMYAELGYNVLAADLDPQSNLTSMFLEDDRLETLWGENPVERGSANTIFQCLEPLMQVGDLLIPQPERVALNLSLIPGDLALAGFEDTLSAEWPNALGSNNLYRPFRILTAFSTIMQGSAKQVDASIILADVGPNLGAINRSALIATDYVVVPLGADLFSLQGLRNLGPTLDRWRDDWKKRRDNWTESDFPLPQGEMHSIGYVVQQHGIRLSRPVKAYDKWVNRIPEEYAKQLLKSRHGPYPPSPDQDEHALAMVKHYRSLVPMAQEARKPIFKLNAADGALGSHAGAATNAHSDFKALAEAVAENIPQMRRAASPTS
jgi:cellulose biosynthesis protein BcsQ